MEKVGDGERLKGKGWRWGKGLHPERGAEGAGAVVGLGPVVIGEDAPEAAIAEESASELADFGRSFDPGGGFEVEFAELLELVVLVLGEEFHGHFGGELDRAVFWFVFFTGVECGAVVAEAGAALGTFGGAIEKGVFAGCRIVRDHIWFAAGAFHFADGPEFCRVCFEAIFHGTPIEPFMPLHVALEPGFQGGEQYCLVRSG